MGGCTEEATELMADFDFVGILSRVTFNISTVAV